MPRQTSVLAPSILAADFARLGEETQAALDAGADWVHFDVMDNHYVPNLSFGPMVCRALRKAGVRAPIDVHLMTSPVDELARAFADAGADWISFHPDAVAHVNRTLRLVRELGCRPGLALNPAVAPEALRYSLEEIDMALVMSVNPGFGGQAFIPAALDKLRELRAIIDAGGREIRLAVDGGINAENIADVAAAGADTFVAGSAIFGAEDRAAAVAALRARI